MHIRLIFRNYQDDRYHDGGTQEASEARVWMSGLRHVGGTSRKIRWFTFPEGSKRRRKAIKLADATLPRKASKEIVWYPYRKPTQVGEEKILRRK